MPGAGAAPDRVRLMLPVAFGAIVRLGRSIEVWAVVSGVRRFRATLNVSGVVPMLVSWNCWVNGKVEVFTTPKDAFAGDTIRVFCRANAALALPEPTASTEAGRPFSVGSCVAVFTIADLISSAESAGRACLTSAARPAICGAEKLVP